MTCRSPRSEASVTLRPLDARRVEVRDGVAEHSVVHQRGQQVVGRGHGVGIAGEVYVDLILGHDAGIAAAGAAALDPEDWPQRRLAQVDRHAVAEPAHSLGQADGRGGLALAGGCGCDAGDDDQLALAGDAASLMASREILAL